MEIKVAYDKMNELRPFLEAHCVEGRFVSAINIDKIENTYRELTGSQPMNRGCSSCVNERIWDAYRYLIHLEKQL